MRDNSYNYKDKDGNFIDFYQLLGIPDTAKEDIINRAYKAKCIYAN